VTSRLLLLALCLLWGVACAQPAPPPNLRIAIFGDQGLQGEKGNDPDAVLAMVKAEGAQAVVHLGDFDYQDSPRRWERQINRVLGERFPYFAVMGNHDVDAWCDKWLVLDGYGSRIRKRLERLRIAYAGSPGVQYSFTWQGIFFVLVSPGDEAECQPPPMAHEAFVREQLAANGAAWSIAGWHRNQTLMQTGDKKDDAGWAVYEEARKAGAIIATAHEHVYARTHLLSSIGSPAVASSAEILPIEAGKSFVFVSGAGGRSMRPQRRSAPWWARVYATRCVPSDRNCVAGNVPGVLFATFHVDGQPDRALFYFKTIDGKVLDRFTVISRAGRADL
jgi:hypothetical protein